MLSWIIAFAIVAVVSVLLVGACVLLRRITSEITSLRDRLEQLASDARAALGTVEERVKRLEAELSATTEKFPGIEQKLEGTYQKLGGVEAQLAAAEKQRAAEEKRLEDLASSALAAFEALEQRVRELEAELSATTEKFPGIEQKLEETYGKLVEVEAELATAEGQRAGLEERLGQVEAERDTARGEVLLVKRQLDKLREELRDVETGLQRAVERRRTELEKKVRAEPCSPSTNRQRPPPAKPSERTQDEESTAVAVADRSRDAQERDSSWESSKKERRPLTDRGGRPRGTEGQRSQSIRPRVPKPEIVCRRLRAEWEVGVELPDDFLSERDISVCQNNSDLQEEEGFWPLNELSGEVTVYRGDEVISSIRIPCPPMLFKLGARSSNRGRLVKSVSSGRYLAIVPDTWERDDEEAGEPPVEPEWVLPDGYQAHYFDLDPESSHKIAFIGCEGNKDSRETTSLNIDLVGNRLPDATQRTGPLFGGEPPRIRAPEDSWRRIRTIVIGEEGLGRGKWKDEFNPGEDGVEKALPWEIRKTLFGAGGGWYFLRFYDENSDLLDSCDFRFLKGLKEVRVPTLSAIPGPNGHQAVTVELVHDAGWTIKPVDNDPAQNIECRTTDGKTILLIPPNPPFDLTRWHVSSREDARIVEVSILIERIWWTVGEEHSEADTWGDKTIPLKREDFRADSKKVLWLRLPRERWIDEVRVGFNQSDGKPFQVRATQKTIAIALREFCDHKELATLGTHQLCVALGETGPSLATCKLRVSVSCNRCDFVSDAFEDLWRHVESDHLGYFFRKATWADMRELFADLPAGIYRCGHCNHYVRLDNAQNPTSAMLRHIENECPNFNRRRGDHPTLMPVDDPEEIRQHVIKNLPEVKVCNWCGESFQNPKDSHLSSHIYAKHRDDLYKLE